MNKKDSVSGWKRAARVAGCSASQVRRLVQAGRLPVEKDERGVHHFVRADLEALRGDKEAEEPTMKPRSKTKPMEPEEPASAPVTPVPAPARVPAAGALAAKAFRLLDGGSGPADLVVAMEIEPAKATELFEDWKGARIAGQQADLLRDAIDLVQHLKAAGWTCSQVMAAWGKVLEASELYQEEGFTTDDALALLRIVRERELDFEEATNALHHLPALEQQQALARAAEARVGRAEARAQEARGTLDQLQAEIAGLWPHAQWLRLSKALAMLIRDGGVQELRDALALTPFADSTMADQMLAHVPLEDEGEARRQLAVWAASELSDLVMLRSEHIAEVERVRQERRMEDVALGALLVRGAP